LTAILGDQEETEIVTLVSDECGTVAENVDFFKD
jgi:hypothetical protein